MFLLVSARHIGERFRFEDEDERNFTFSHIFSKIDTPENFIVFFSPAKLAPLFPFKEVKPSPGP